MTIYRSLDEAKGKFGPSALTIGNFDGVHTGHRQILRRLKELGSRHGWKPSVLTFDPHPTRVVAPDRAPRLLTTPDRRAELMAGEGIEQVLILPFTRELAQVPAEEFVRLLTDRLGARAILVGDNFRFGHRHAGNVQLLQDLGHTLGFTTEIIPAVVSRGRVVSSSVIRELIQAGRVSTAARLLERPYELDGTVVSGRGVGSRQTVPTLNLDTTAETIPALGVYITRTRDLNDGRDFDSITNIGYRPTFGLSDQLSIETFLLTPLTGATPQHMRLEFFWRIREERKFDSPESLKAQILKDVAATQRYFRRVKTWVGRIPCTSS
jgi:riboflavin kinase/FMN adenylyltransferase